MNVVDLQPVAWLFAVPGPKTREADGQHRSAPPKSINNQLDRTFLKLAGMRVDKPKIRDRHS